MDTLIAALGDDRPDIADDVFVSPGVVVIGDVTVRARASLWYGCVLRAENAPIAIGADTNVQDGCVLHTDAGFPATLGARVSVGHRAVLHGCTVADDVLIGMSSTLLNGATIGPWSLVAAGAVVRERFAVPEGTLVGGVPAKVIRELTEEEREKITRNSLAYLDLARRHGALRAGT